MDILRQLHLYSAPGQGKLYVTSLPADASLVAAMTPADQPGVPQMAQSAKPTIEQLRFQQATEARTACTGQNEGPGSPGYPECVNDYLQGHYGWRVVGRRDGSLRAAAPLYPGGNAAGGIGRGDFNPTPQPYIPNTGYVQHP